MAVVLAVLGAIVTVVSSIGVIVRAELVSTEAVVEAIGPMAADSQVQSAVSDSIVAELTPVLPAIIADQVGPVVEATVGPVMDSATFRAAWDSVVTDAHSSAVRAFENGTTERIALQLGPLVAAAKDALMSDGQTWAEWLPEVDGVIEIGTVTVSPIQHSMFMGMMFAGTWGPWIAAALWLLALLVAPRRGLIMVGLGLTAAITGAAGWLALRMARGPVVDAISSGGQGSGRLSADAIGVMYDALFARTFTIALVALGVGLVLAIVGAVVARRR